MRYRILIFCSLFFLLLPCSGVSETAPTLEVSVLGVEGKIHKNILARLRIHRYSEDSNLSDTEIQRLHRLADSDIHSAVTPYGYYSATVEDSLEQTGTGWQATYQVNLGEPVYVSMMSVSVTGEGSSASKLADPQRFFTLKTGDQLNQVLYEKGKKALLLEARARGFLDATYTVHEIRVDSRGRNADIELVLESGPRYKFGPVTSEQDILHDELLQRYVPWAEGDNFIPRKARRLQRELNRTDFFSSAIVKPDTADPDGLEIPVEITLEPLEAYNIYSIGVGYATDTRAHVRFDWRNRLLNKSGHRVNTSLLLGERESHFLVNYKIPMADPRKNTLNLNGLWNWEEWEDTTTNSYALGTTYEYETTRHRLAVSLEMLSEDYRVGVTTGLSKLLLPGIQGSIAIADNIVNTKNGLRASVGISGASDTIASDATFLKIRADGKFIMTPVENFRLIGRGSAGKIFVDSINDIPPSLRFYAGGQKSVRGYRYRSLGPQDRTGAVIGGTYLLTGSLEIERSLYDIWRIGVFYDVGNAMDDYSIDLVQGVGVGAGVALPFGQIKLELAYPLSDEGSSQYVFFSVGADL